MDSPLVNPALHDLEPLVGEWTIEIEFPDEAMPPVFGTATIGWIEGGAFLGINSTVVWQGPSSSTSVIGRDEDEEQYTVLYYDDRGVSRIYHMTLNDSVWHQWRTSPEFSQRFIGTIGLTGDVITARWEASRNGKSWDLDFELTYRRAD